MKDSVEDNNDGAVHHFFLFRHCVRSTAITYDDVLADPAISDYTNTTTTEHMMPRHPAWNVPTNWCTETGVNITQAVGRYLMSECLLSAGNNNNNADDQEQHWHIQFIVDAKAHRDVDTAWALAQGMREAVLANSTKKRVLVTGLDQMFAEEWLFSGCRDDLKVETEQQLLAVLDRLATLPPPPDFPIHQALETIAAFFSDEEFQHLNLTDDVLISNSSQKFAGSVDFIKTFAQMAFYSQASNLPFELYNHSDTLSVSTLYKLLQYVHWSRSITSVDVPTAAYIGAIHATTMLAALRDGTYYPIPPSSSSIEGSSSSSSPTKHATHHRATILTGHDTDLDALATVLGGRWILRPPYISGPAGAYLPTPPLAALHARHHLSTGLVNLQLLYPVYSSSTANSTSSGSSRRSEWVTNVTGVLEETAIIGTPFPVIGTSTRVPSVEVLEQHIRTVLLAAQYKGADRCYQAALQFQQQQQQKPVNVVSQQRHTPSAVVSMTLGVLLLVVITVVGLWMMWVHGRTRTTRQFRYDNMSSSEPVSNAGGVSQLEIA